MGDGFDHVVFPVSDGLEFARGCFPLSIEEEVTAEFDHGHEKVDLGSFGRDLMFTEGSEHLPYIVIMLLKKCGWVGRRRSHEDVVDVDAGVGDISENPHDHALE